MTPPRRAAVLGSPIAHSLSPVLHRAAYAELGLDGWSYGMHECDEAGLPCFVDGLGAEWAGLSLTMPLKRVALQVADEVSPLAAATGAANTLVLRPGSRFADNTDVAGLVGALGRGSGATALVLGAGGTAQAALAALRELGICDVTVAVRSLARTAELRAAAERLGITPVVEPLLAAHTPALPAADVVISTLPGRAADRLGAQMKPGATVLDVVYAPWPTPFAAAATERGARVVSGLEVLLHQAVAQVELMTGHAGPVAAMRAALEAAVAARA
ncbi:MAG: shikimate dehydrogenase [Pseudonocardia sp.]